jgi:hypothetical protein
MEYLTAFLTAVLFWLFFDHCRAEARNTARRRAGPLLRKWIAARSPAKRIALLAVTALFIAELTFLSGLMARSDAIFLLAVQWLNAITVFSIFSPLLAPGVEFREAGIVRYGYGRPWFLPWSSIQYCRTTVQGELQLQRRKYKTLLAKGCIPQGEREEAKAILCRYIEVRDIDGVRSPELSAAGRPSLPDPAQWEHYRFQFDLRTLLFFFLVAGCALSWYGIRYRRGCEEAAVLARLERFKPKVERSGFWLGVDFSASPVKPGDADLEIVAKLSRLQSLNLIGAPVTDAGLLHLEKLASLQWVNLYHTRVTDAGVRRLQQALPKADVSH